MDIADDAPRVVCFTREMAAPAAVVFELIADPAQQPRWDGNNNLGSAAPGQRVRAVGDAFTTLVSGRQMDGSAYPPGPGSRANRPPERVNHVVEFEEGRRIAWRPSEVEQRPPGHLWRWEIVPLGPDRCRVTHTYDWTELDDPARLARARSTTPERLAASVDRLAALAEAAG
ncbi:MAG: SRPBCC family protein [Austwickia sp.]|jgi:hypothetical protein|nr:MAG: SRPBCC family protein [Austwickia sp.]